MRSDTMNRAEWAKYYRTESLKLWVQNFLVGIKKIYLAVYDKEGIVHRIDTEPVSKLYGECVSVTVF